MQDNAGQQYLPGCWCGVAGGFVQGHHMAYSSALEVKSFAFCYCSHTNSDVAPLKLELIKKLALIGSDLVSVCE